LPWHPSKDCLASPLATRPEQDQWFVSFSRRIIQKNVTSKTLKKYLGWDDALVPQELANQLVLLADNYMNYTSPETKK